MVEGDPLQVETRWRDKSGESKETLTRTLDDLLERYLHLIENYQKLRRDLSMHLSNGFMSLAQANFSSPNRAHYGQDYYDQRMQASTLVSLSENNPCFFITRKIVRAASPTIPDMANISNSTSSGPETPETRPKSDSLSTTKACNPINWFGILVPPALRSSQNSFSSAVVDIVPALASVSDQMRKTEIEVRRTRKKLMKPIQPAIGS